MKSEKVFILAVFSMFLFNLSQAQINPPEQEKVLQFRTNQVLIAPDVSELELGNEFAMQESNSLGQTVWMNNCKSIENQINIYGIQPGNYILKLVINEQCHRIKIVVL